MKQWNGQECQVFDVNIIIKDGPDSDFKWWKPHVGKIVKGLKVVTAFGQSFYLYDGDGSATRKVDNGGGPNMSHKGFDDVEETIDDPNTEIVECTDHEWSEESLPIFNTESRYCIKCRASEFILNHMSKRMM